MNNTQGLLGTFNGDKTDDLQYPNGTTIPANASEEQIFGLGQKCKLHNKRSYLNKLSVLQKEIRRQKLGK